MSQNTKIVFPDLLMSLMFYGVLVVLNFAGIIFAYELVFFSSWRF